MKKKKCFISYSRKDYDFAFFLYNMLLLYDDEFVTAWIDKNIAAGGSWQQIINQNIDTSNVFFAVFSEDFDRSSLCRNEFHRFFERKQHKDNELTLIPIKIDDYASYDPSKFIEPKITQFNWIDFTEWQTRGDRIFAEELLPFIVSREQSNQRIIQYGQSPHLRLESESLKKVLRTFKNKISNEEQAISLINLIVSYTQKAELSFFDRAELLTEISDLFVQRGEWKKVLSFNENAIKMLGNIEGSANDHVNILFGFIFIRLSIAHRKLRTESPQGFLIRALEHFEKLSNRVLSSDFQAQAYRELGTYFLITNKPTEAKQAFQKSFELLKYLPSQKQHTIQAQIKLLQTNLFSQNFEESQLLLNELTALFELIELGEHSIEVVYSHFLLTKALSSIIMKVPSKELKETLFIHREIAKKYGFSGEMQKNTILRWSYPFLLLLPSKVIIKMVQLFFRTK